ncbi:peptidase M4 [Streptomyces sulfonofaciens]|uniref:Neutral metalloproteinase n=1 Tax=Streptomyces sulfonofaciens TaxID=68272 RepID=A0A919GA84_9ACTN|nr:M4 family metallopeptidase [Streptomyces sulfonofaciens]GHH80704.1 peptidase M4 [Streptomyces sulfonofaciens]
MFVAIAALLSIGAQAGVAAEGTAGSSQATISDPAPALGKVDKGALPVSLSPDQRTALIKKASAATADTARRLGLGAKEKLVVRDVVKDADGTTHTRYERTYDGLPVLGGDLVVDATGAGAAKGITPAVRTHLGTVRTEATVRPATAEKQALGAATAKGAEQADTDRAPRKVVWLAKGTPVLAYETVVGGLQDDGTPNQLHVITDASTGKQLYSWQGIENGTGNTEYSGTVTLGTQLSGSTYTLTDTGRGNHKTYNLAGRTSGTGTLYSGSDDVWGNGQPTNSETAAADAHYGAALTWDYYKNVQGRTGIRGDGVGAYSRVHYGNQYVNAFWDDSCFCMTYGDGFGNTSPLTSIDVAAHEMSHGVTSATAGLNYSGESGGLNEATSDIFASAVEFYANNPSDPGDYLIGEKIDINGDGTPLRYQDKPSRDGISPDSWSSGLGGLDVHYSSGPANHFFYLLSEGSGAKDVNGVHYDSPTADGLPVTGIGRDKAALIWFKALTTKFTSTTNYAAARSGTLAVAGELYGTSSAEYKSVADAWAAIKVGSRPGGGDPGTGTTFESNTRVTIPDRGTGTSSITVSGISGNAPSDLAVSVDIVHTYRGDLVIDLVAPNGATARLKDADGFDSGQDVQETYTVDGSSVAANGTWKLRVQDTAAQDTGYINGWKLTF